MLDNMLFNPLNIIDGKIILTKYTVNKNDSPLNPGAVKEIRRGARIKPKNDIARRITNVMFIVILATLHASSLFFLVSYLMNMGIKVTFKALRKTAVINWGTTEAAR